jgi:hypothetical protein
MKWMNNAPWWLVSAGLHAVLLLGAALIYVEKLLAIEEVQFVVRTDAAGLPPVINKIESPRDVTGHKSPIPVDPDPAADPKATFLFDPSAKFADTEESEDNDPARKRKGQDFDAYGFIPGQEPGIKGKGLHGPGLNDSLGVGGGFGASRRKGGKEGGMRNTLVKVGGGGDDTESAVTAALRWLARHQNGDGSWSASGFSHKCVNGKCSGNGEADYDAGVTSLSLLAFLGAGYSQLSRDEFTDPAVPGQTLSFGEVVKKSLQWLTLHQDPEGCVGERGQKYMYNHAIAALALSEAYGMTAAPILHEPAQKAIDFLVAAQNPGKGWRYSSKCGDNDTSVTGWAVMALKSAEISGLSFPATAFAGALNWLNEATEQNGYYRTGYNQAGTGKVYVPGKNEQFMDHPSMSAVAVMSRIFIQKKRDQTMTAVNHLVSDLPAWKGGQTDFYYWYYASLALFQYDGPKGPFWAKWNEPMKNAIVPHQKTAGAGCENGSWDPSADRWGFEGGRVYAAAINCLTLEVYYRYAHVFGGAAK